MAVGEIFLDKLLPLVSESEDFKPLPKYPPIDRDLSLALKLGTRVGDVVATARNAAPALLEDIQLLDVYEMKKGIMGSERGRSITLRFVFRAKDKTLTDGDVNREVEKIVEALKVKFDVAVR